MSERGQSPILQVLAPGRVGGLERVVQNLAKGLHRRAHPVVVAVLGGSEANVESYAEALRQAGVPVETAVVPHRHYLRERMAVRRICERHRPAIVHSHGYRPDVLAGSVARGRGLPTVTTVHGFTSGDWKNQLYERIQLRAFRRFDAVVAVSEPLLRDLAARGVPQCRLVLIRNAWDAAVQFADRRSARSELGLPHGGVVIGWVGRLSREKAPEVMLDAMTHLADLDLTLALVGSGGQEPALHEKARGLGIEDGVLFIGTVDEAARLYPAFDCFVLSSRTEGTPIVLFEAMAAGVPIVATRVGGVPDVVEESEAVLVPPDDPEALAGAIRRTLADSEAAAVRTAAARARLHSAFDAESWLDRYESLYSSLTSVRDTLKRR